MNENQWNPNSVHSKDQLHYVPDITRQFHHCGQNRPSLVAAYLDVDLALGGQAGVEERLHDRDVGILQLGVLAHQGNGDALGGVVVPASHEGANTGDSGVGETCRERERLGLTTLGPPNSFLTPFPSSLFLSSPPQLPLLPPSF